ncbi:MAG TPA: GNAT family N-acetyltransferase [Flavobacteriaceae bacterium]|nr:GNAT family N-acetyltransferase [Flavobacteriaceae bacterium]
MTSYKIRPAEKHDMHEVLLLIKELAVFEKEPEAVEITVEDLQRDGFGEKKLFFCFVAEVEGQIQGMALAYFRYSTWKGKTVHLEDLIVREEFRGIGLGAGLYEKVMQFAKNEGVKRVEWVVLDWNSGAIEFYKKTGATILKNWHLAQFDEKALDKFLSNRK